MSVATKWSDQTPYVYLLDPVTLESLSTMKLVKSDTSDLAGGVYSLVTIDPASGAVTSSTPYGSAAGDNPLQMVSMISPSGVLYQGTERGLIRVAATSTAVPEIDPAFLGSGIAFLMAVCGLLEERARRTAIARTC